MKHWFLVVALLILGCSSHFSAQNSSNAPLSAVETPPGITLPPAGEVPPAPENYFGYYASQMDGIGTIEDITELKGRANFVFIHSGDMENRLQRCRELGMKAMVSFSWLFLDTNARLYADWQTRIIWATAIMDKFPDVIIANYLLDEPYMNGAQQGLTVEEVYTQLETLGQYFKTRYPKMPIAVIFSASELNKGFRLPPTFDWFGMDCYGSFTWCDRNSIPGYYTKIKNEIAKLEAADHRTRYLMAVPPSGYEMNDDPNEANHLNQVPQYRKFVKSEPKMKIVIPFVWQSFGTPPNGWNGARTSVKLKEAYEKFYSDFIAGTL